MNISWYFALYIQSEVTCNDCHLKSPENKDCYTMNPLSCSRLCGHRHNQSSQLNIFSTMKDLIRNLQVRAVHSLSVEIMTSVYGELPLHSCSMYKQESYIAKE